MMGSHDHRVVCDGRGSGDEKPTANAGSALTVATNTPEYVSVIMEHLVSAKLIKISLRS